MNVWQQAFAGHFDQALDQLERALADCPEHLWEMDLWPDQATTGPADTGGIRGSAPWCIAFHALFCLDYDLTGEFEPWAPPKPFDESTYADPNRVFTRDELLGYSAFCRTKVHAIAVGLTDELAARPLPPGHRYAGQLFAVTVGGMALHVAEHAAQIRQFLTTEGVVPAGGFVPGT